MPAEAAADAMEQAWPPARTNPDLIGEGEAEGRLLAAFRSGRLPQSWLLTGPRGIGKATLAYRFARFLLSDGAGGAGDLFGGAPDDLGIDPESPVFRQVASGGHRDLMSLERGVNPKTGKPRSEIVVDDVRKLRSFLQMTAADAGWRVAVVDPVDDMNTNAANALLKMLEEPPARALLLLVSHAPGRLLPTIRSRCCRLNMAPLTEAEVGALLGRYAPQISEEDAGALARLSEGSIGRALELAEGGGLELYQELVATLETLPRLDLGRVYKLADRLGRDNTGRTFRTGTELLSWWLARMIRAGSDGQVPPEVVGGEAALMARLVERRGLAPWLTLWEKLTRLFARAEGVNLDRRQVVVTAFLELETLAS